MTRDELIEAMAEAMHDYEYTSAFDSLWEPTRLNMIKRAEAALAAIEAAGGLRSQIIKECAKAIEADLAKERGAYDPTAAYTAGDMHEAYFTAGHRAISAVLALRNQENSKCPSEHCSGGWIEYGDDAVKCDHPSHREGE